MPQVQVLPRLPTFGSRLAEALGQAGGKIAQGYKQRKAQEDFNKLFSGLQANQNAASEDQFQSPNTNEITPQNPNQSPLANLMDPLSLPLLHKKAADAYGQKFADVTLQSISDAQKRQFDVQHEIAKEQRAKASKIEEEQRKEEKKIDTRQKALSNVDNILKSLESKKAYVGSEFGSKTIGLSLGLRREAIQRRKQIESEAIGLETYFRDRVSKGTFPVTMFNALLERLPNAEMSEREYQGAIDGIRSLLVAEGYKLPEDEKAKTQANRPPLTAFYK